MIVPMKKVSLVMLESRRRTALQKLRTAGVLHVESAGKSSAELEGVRDKISLIDRALAAFPQEKTKSKTSVPVGGENPLELAAKIAELAEQRRVRREEADRLRRETDRLRQWGDFEPETVKILAARGVFVRLYEIGNKEVKKFGFNGQSYTAFKGKEKTGIVAVARSEEDFPAGFEQAALPAQGLDRLQQTLAEKEKDIAALSGQINQYIPHQKALTDEANKLRFTAEFEQTAADLSLAEERLAYLSGFIPDTKVEELKKVAAAESWGLLVDDPAPDEAVPTLLRNPKPVRLIQPVMDFLGLVPGYRERDISFFFIVFFSIFVAMIIGDAGYAMIFLTASVFFGLKARRKIGRMPDAFILFIVMGLCTFVWGAMSANFFGIKGLDEVMPFSLFVNKWITGETQADGQKNVMMLCYVLAVIHLFIARIWDFFQDIRRRPRIKAFVHIGYLCLLSGFFLLVLNMLIDSRRFPFPSWALYTVVTGYGFVLLLSQQEGKFFKGLLMGVAQFLPTTLNCIGVFSDIISYVRLFAVGLAGLAIAQAFNTMAAPLMEGAAMAGGILVLVLGHTLNIGMCLLSVIVHGVRLNVLEFSNHLGLEWSGFAYSPFREREKEAQAS